VASGNTYSKNSDIIDTPRFEMTSNGFVTSFSHVTATFKGACFLRVYWSTPGIVVIIIIVVVVSIKLRQANSKTQRRNVPH